MKRLFLIAVVVVAAPYLAIAAEPEASEASIREMMTLTGSRKLLDSATDQFDASAKSNMQRVLANKVLKQDQQTIIDETEKKMIALVKDEMRWESLEPIFIDIYRKSFTQKEVDGIIDFYKSPAGQAMIAKFPIVIQNTTQVMTERRLALSSKLSQLGQDMEVQLKASASQQQN